MKQPIRWKGKVILILISLLITTLVGWTVLDTIHGFENMIKTCQENGYDGIQDISEGLFSRNDWRCYKEIPSETGTGVYTVYSGELK